MKEDLQRPHKGLYMDSSYIDQPKATYSFALNAVSESLEGDNNKISFEQSNEISILLPDGLSLLNTTYIGKNSFCVFLVGNHSEIGIINLDRKSYVTKFSDLNSTEKLNLNIAYPIEAVYRLRRGCDQTIYFTDDYNLPRYFNLSSPTDFKKDFITNPVDYKDVDKYWNIDKFNLIKTYNSIPKYKRIEVKEGGILKAGSYNFAIQYLDNDLNPSEWLNVSDTIIIYHDNAFETSYESVRGSTNKKTLYQDFGITNKSIKLEIENLDLSYAFYRIGIIEATAGTGQVTDVVYSENLSIRQNIFNYTGSNAVIKGTIEEIALFQNDIKKAKSILQIENRILLGNIQGSLTNLCKLQKYASKIKPNFTSKKIILNSIESETNQKNAEIHHFVKDTEDNSIGYMPGEIYSFGIVYIFTGGVKSPVYHIPGVSPEDEDTLMSKDNILETTSYIDNEQCDNNIGYWGLDYLGNPLANENVRHHRFPSRKELHENPNVEENFNLKIAPESPSTPVTNNILKLQEDTVGPLNGVTEVRYKVSYTIEGEIRAVTGVIDLTGYNENNTTTNFNIVIVTNINEITNPIVEEIDSEGNVINPGDSNHSGIDFITVLSQELIQVSNGVNTSRIMGINFNNITIPTKEEIGEEIIGYYIVQNKRDEDNKTVLDTGVLLPLTEHENWQGVGFLSPDTNNLLSTEDPEHTESNLVKGVYNKYALFHPENAFSNKEYTNAQIEYHSIYGLEQVVIKENKDIQDAQPGTSYNPERHDKSERDTDGFTLQILSRKVQANVNLYEANGVPAGKDFISDVKNIKYLNSLHSFSVEEEGSVKEIFNLSADNRFAVVTSNQNMPSYSVPAYPSDIVEEPFLKFGLRKTIVTLKRPLSDPYSNFRTLAYYKASKNIQDSSDTETSVFSGDSYISPITLTSSIFSDVRIRARPGKKPAWWKVVIGVIISAAAIIATAGTALPLVAGIAASTIAVGFTVSAVASGIKTEKMNEVYNNLYEQGLKNVVHDVITKKTFGPNPNDDSIQWFSDVIEGLYLESSVNMNWRIGSSGEIPDFANSPKNYSIDFHLDRLADKLSVLDPENDSGRLYQGFCNAELYEVNLDYLRREAEKPFFHLPIEYDCCSDCPEDFPGRWVWSEQSFQEELTDNYRSFLPLSYRDIQGESGDLINLFSVQDNIYLHTENSLWNLPKNFQERVTDQVVSFIGTGDYFSIPPKLIKDSINGNNSGNQHQRGVLKTPYGVVFVSENEKGIFLFDGKSLQPIHLQGISNWLKNNLNVFMIDLFQERSQLEYPLKDAPYSKYGTGYVLGYDPRKQRVLITKKDFIINNEEILTATDLYLGFEGENVFYLSDLQGQIDALNEGEEYLWKIDSYEGSQIFLKKESYKQVSTPGKDELGVLEYKIDMMTLNALPITLETFDNSWTISYNLKKRQWESFMSYFPNKYLTTGNEFYSYKAENSNSIWRHNIKGKYNSFYGNNFSTIVEYVNINSPETRVLNALKLYTEAKKYDSETDSFINIKNKTYNKAVFYNSRQCSGLLTLVPKEEDENSWFSPESSTPNLGEILIDKREEDWNVNEIRDIRIDYSKPIWIKSKEVLNSLPFIDKVLNEETLDFNKDWQQMERLRDKYLVVRLIFDNFEDINILLNYSYLNESSSES